MLGSKMAAGMMLLTLLALALKAEDAVSKEYTADCIPCASEDSKTIHIAVLLQEKTAIRALPVIYLARQDLEKNGLRGPLQGWNVSIVYRDSECSSVTAPFEAVELHNQGAADLFLGPVCDYALASVCRFAKRWGTPILSPAGKPEAFNNNPQFEMLTRLNGYYTQMAEAVKSICEHWRWTTVGVLYEDAETDSAALSLCHHQMSEVYRILKQANYAIKHAGFKNNDNIEAIVLHMATSTRVIFFCAISEAKVKETMMAAEKNGLTSSGEYVFFNINLDAGPSETYRPWGPDEPTEQEQSAFSAMFTITSRTPNSANYLLFSEQVKNLTKDPAQRELQQLLRGMTNSSYPDDLVTPYMASFYEGVMLYASAFNRTQAKRQFDNFSVAFEKRDSNYSKQILKEIVTGTFYSHLREQNVTLMDSTIADDYSVLNMDEKKKKYRVVSVFWGQWSTMNMTGLPVLWPGPNSTVVPRDSPMCGFNNELCERDDGWNYWIILILSLLVLLLGLCSIVAIRFLTRLISMVGRLLR